MPTNNHHHRTCRRKLPLPLRTGSACAAILTLSVASGAAADTIFVNAAQVLPTAFQTGNSWGFAYKDLQTALASAIAGDDIWVAKGTYKPTLTGDRFISFIVPNGVRIFGGFQSGALSLASRNPDVNLTILSGELGAAGNADNSLHVVKGFGLSSSTILSGFIIVGGNANGGGSNNFGGGMTTTGSAQIIDCVFVGNSAVVSGGGIHLAGSGVTIPMAFSNCVFMGNSAGVTGGAGDFQNGNAHFTFCTIRGNSGGGLRFLNGNGSSVVANSIVRDNTASGTPLQQQVTFTNASVSITSCNINGISTAGGVNIDADPLFLDADGADNITHTLDDDLRLRGSSPCIDRGSSGFMIEDSADLDGDGDTNEQIPLDLAGAPRRVEDFMVPNGPGSVNPAPDIGAFEFQRPRTILVDINATGANNGLNWQDAYTSLQSAILELNEPKFGGPGEIWVAEGTYKPTTTTNQTISFLLPLDGQIYGGFAGGELERTLRDWVAHPTILSGEIGNQNSVNDNTNSVIFATGAFYGNDTLLDGVIVTRGNGGTAGGIYLKTNASPTIRHCRVLDNLTGIVVEGNQAAVPVIDNCIISGNANRGLDITFSNAQVTNCTVAFNTAGFNSGAGIKCDGATAIVRNCLVFGNAASGLVTQAAQIGKPSGDGLVNALISCCAIQGFNTGYPNDVNCFAIGADGGCVDANGVDNIAGNLDDNYAPTPCSDLVDAGDNAVSFPDALDYDSDGNTTEAVNEDFAGGVRRVDLPVPNSGLGVGGVDIGAFELQPGGLPDPDLDNDGDVDGADLALVLGAWLTVNGAIDLNGDCTIDGADLAIVLGAWTG